MASAADVPGKYDVVIDGHGYVLLDSLTPNIPFRTHRATYSYSPTFVERQNVSNQYGDNAFDFFMTIRQRDWSLGEQQKFFRSGNDGRYWLGTATDVRTAGQVSMRQAVKSLTFASAPTAICTYNNSQIAVFTATNLYLVDQSGTIADQGAHGLGTSPLACVQTGSLVMFSGSGVGIRSFDGASFAAFSGTGAADDLAFMNNTLYGASNEFLIRQWDTGGTASTIYTWKNATGTSTGSNLMKLAPYGSKLLVLRNSAPGTDLWIYDGVAPSLLASLPPSFFGSRIVVNYGIAFISGVFVEKEDATNRTVRPAIYFFDGSSIGLLWQASTTLTTTKTQEDVSPAITNYGSGVVFSDDTVGQFMFYNPASGGVSTLGSYTAAAGTKPLMATTQKMFLHTRTQTAGWMFPDASNVATSTTIVSSLIDFESSLAKLFQGVAVEFDSASDGNGGSVDIDYQVDSLTGSWTSLRAGAVSGTEYTLSNVSGHAVAIRVTLNKGTSTLGPILKALRVRGAPRLLAFKKREYILDLTGAAPDSPRSLRDGSPNPNEPHDDATALITSATSSSPISITDRFGTFTGIIELDGFEIAEMHAQMQTPSKSGSFVVRVAVREV